MPCAHIWTGQEVRRLQRFSDKLKLASGLVGQDDHLANLMLEDALEDLHGLLGERSKPVSDLGGGVAEQSAGLARAAPCTCKMRRGRSAQDERLGSDIPS